MATLKGEGRSLPFCQGLFLFNGHASACRIVSLQGYGPKAREGSLEGFELTFPSLHHIIFRFTDFKVALHFVDSKIQSLELYHNNPPPLS